MGHHIQIERLAQDLKGHARVLIWGEMGVGKSTLALELARLFNLHHGGGRILSLDPGNPAFGVPGALNRGCWHGGIFRWHDCQALCTLDAARFRLPLFQAAGRMINDAGGDALPGPMVIDPPGVVRGAAGAELLTALVMALEVDAVVALIREGRSLPLAGELTWLPVVVMQQPASRQAARPPRQERAAQRTRLWDNYLAGGAPATCHLQDAAILGTPPPREMPAAWAGRQAALLDSQGRTLAMGEVAALTGEMLTLRMPPVSKAAYTGILIRDAGRNARGYLETIPHNAPFNAGQRFTTEMPPLALAPDADSAPVFSRVGTAWATLVGGVFGDPLVHVRLRNQKRSFLFDLGDPARLAARVAHQVSAVCLSHAHMDHIGGFFWFLRSRIGTFGPCKIFGPAETITRIENFLGAITWDRIEDNAPVFEIGEFDGHTLKQARLQPGSPKIVLPERPVKDGVLLDQDDLSISAVVCDHKIPSLAYGLTFRIEISVRKERLAASGLVPGPWLGKLKQCIAAQTHTAMIDLPDGTRRSAGELARELTIIRPGKKIVYAADMADTPANREKIIALANTAHTLFCETAFTMAHQDKARATQHLTTLAAMDIARRAGVERLVPFHFSKRYEDDPAAVYQEILSAAGPVKIIGHFH